MYLRGNVNTLKKQISQGVPVILFIRVHPKQRYLHFVPVVGYDETHFYLAESLEHKINCDEEYYNRKISISELNTLWRSWLPFVKTHISLYTRRRCKTALFKGQDILALNELIGIIRNVCVVKS